MKDNIMAKKNKNKTVEEAPGSFRCFILPNAPIMTDEKCDSRKSHPDVFPKCKKCQGRNVLKPLKIKKLKVIKPLND
jgi:hypothetical protein